MNFQEALQNLFTFNNSTEAIIFAVILFLTFLLGILVWFVLVHLPQRIRLRKDLKLLRTDFETLAQNYKQLEEKYSVQTAKVQRLEDEATNRNLLLEEKENRLAQIEALYAHLEAERDDKAKAAQLAQDERNELQKLYKYAQLEIVEANNKETIAQQSCQAAEAQVETMKTLMEEMEQDRQKAVAQKTQIEEERHQIQIELKQLHQGKEELSEKLDTTLNKLAIYEAEDIEGMKRKNRVLSEELIQLQEKLQQIQNSKDEIAQTLEGYTAKEIAEEQAVAEQERLMEELLEAAEAALGGQGLFQDIAETELIEDQKLQEKRFAESVKPTELTVNLEENNVELDEDEVEQMDQAMTSANDAMSLQGFFQDIEEAVLVVQEEEPLDDEVLLSRALDNTTDAMLEHPFFTDLSEEDLVEDRQLLESQLQQQPETTARGGGELEEEVLLTDEEEMVMSRALESANFALNAEGLYTSIDPSKLIEAKKEQVLDQEVIVHPKYKTALEKYVVAAIGKTIPRGNELQKDDLKQIHGIGSFVEEKLNYLGFFNFEQIAALTEADYREKLTAVLGLSANTIEYDQWVIQAKELITKGKLSTLTKDLNTDKLYKK